MSDREPNDRSEQIFVRKGLATPSPETQEELEGLSPRLPTDTEDGRPTAGQAPLGESDLDETAPAGSLLSVDLRQHTGRAWIEAQKSQSPGQGLTAEVSATLLLRQGNLPLDAAPSGAQVSRDRAQTWKQLREELEAELTPVSERDEIDTQALPSWAEIKETLAREIGGPPNRAEANRESEDLTALPPESTEPLEPILPHSGALEGGREEELETALPEKEANSSAPEDVDQPTEPDPTEQESARVELIATVGLASEPTIKIDGTDVGEPDVDGPDFELPDFEAIESRAESRAETAEPSADGAAGPPEPQLSASEPAQVLSKSPESGARTQAAPRQTETFELEIPDEVGGEAEKAMPSPPVKKPRQTLHLIGATLGFLATIVIGAGLWFQFGPGRESPAEAPPPQVTEPGSARSDTGSVASEPKQEEEPSAVLKLEESSGQAALSASSGTPEPMETAAAAAPGETTGTAAPAESAAGADTLAIEPSFDLIRIEANGEAVIAGRAVPNTDLILLDKGKPIGATRSNADGEWAFIPDQPLPPGEHEFAMVISTPQGEVLVPERTAEADAADGSGDALASPAAQVESQPLESAAKGLDSNSGSEEGALLATDSVKPPSTAQGVTKLGGSQTLDREESIAGDGTVSQTAPLPTPRSKPETLLAQASPYGIQLSSNNSRNAAQKSWQSLQGRFPDLLGDKRLLIQEITLDQGGTRFRVQTGFFENLGAARKLCRAFAQRQQDCLVFRR